MGYIYIFLNCEIIYTDMLMLLVLYDHFLGFFTGSRNEIHVPFKTELLSIWRERRCARELTVVHTLRQAWI